MHPQTRRRGETCFELKYFKLNLFQQRKIFCFLSWIMWSHKIGLASRPTSIYLNLNGLFRQLLPYLRAQLSSLRDEMNTLRSTRQVTVLLESYFIFIQSVYIYNKTTPTSHSHKWILLCTSTQKYFTKTPQRARSLGKIRQKLVDCFTHRDLLYFAIGVAGGRAWTTCPSKENPETC